VSTFRFDRVTVVGAGTMGRGIAQVCAASGSRVRLVDVDQARADAGRASIGSGLDKLVEKGKLTAAVAEQTMAAIEASGDMAAAAAGCDVFIEAVLEDMALKRRVFGEAARRAGAHTLLGTNTSSLPISEIARDNPAAGRIIGLHFFNPVPVMALVEVVRGQQTAEPTLAAALEFARRLGKDPIVVKDSPGFATSRLGVLLGLEAMRMLEQGVASAADIDKAMELGYRHPMGPLKLTDLVGLDVRLAIAEHLHRELGTETFAPPALLRQMVAAGKLGRKSGVGFYTY